MFTMKTFYDSLASASKIQNLYLRALVELTKIDTCQMKVLASDLGWQQWGESIQQAVTV